MLSEIFRVVAPVVFEGVPGRAGTLLLFFEQPGEKPGIFPQLVRRVQTIIGKRPAAFVSSGYNFRQPDSLGHLGKQLAQAIRAYYLPYLAIQSHRSGFIRPTLKLSSTAVLMALSRLLRSFVI